MCARVRVPELPPRVVALAYHRRPPPGAPARALFDVLREVLAARASDQPGVRLGTDAFPLAGPSAELAQSLAESIEPRRTTWPDDSGPAPSCLQRHRHDREVLRRSTADHNVTVASPPRMWNVPMLTSSPSGDRAHAW